MRRLTSSPKPAARVAAAYGWELDVHPLPPLLHNRPRRIAGEVERLAGELAASYDHVVVGYADCGTYGALDAVCRELGLARLPGLHCYDVYAGASRLRGFLEEQPGTYLLTDFLVRSFARTVERELGLVEEPPAGGGRGRVGGREGRLGADAVVHPEVGVCGTLVLAEAVDEGGDGHGERGRVGVAGDLDLELGRDAAACFFT